MSEADQRLISRDLEARLLELAGSDNPNVAALVHIINSVERGYASLFYLYAAIAAAEDGNPDKAGRHREEGTDNFRDGLAHPRAAVRALGSAAMMGDTGHHEPLDRKAAP